MTLSPDHRRDDPVGSPWNWWQSGVSPSAFPKSAIVEGCISAYARTVATCPGAHWRESQGGGRERVTNSALSRILQRPNSYQTTSDFMLSAVRDLYADGNAYALAFRNDRFEIDELHLMRASLCRPMVAETGDVFYYLGGNEVVAKWSASYNLVVPARDVLHIRLTPSETRSPYPLVGESPMIAAALDMATIGAISQQTLTFVLNQARPSAVLSTDLTLDRAQAEDLRQRWNDQSRDMNQGRTPILSSGLKVVPWTTGCRDAQIAELLKLSDEHIMMAFGVPLQVLGLGDARYANAEALMTQWVASGLGFALAHIEASFDRLFRLAGEPREYTEFDTSALLRSAFKDRIAALTAASRAGCFRPMRRARSKASRRPSTATSRDCKPRSCHCRPPARSPRPRPLRPPRWLSVAPARRLSGAEIRRGGQNILAAAERAAAAEPETDQAISAWTSNGSHPP